MFSTIFHLYFINNFDNTEFLLNNEHYIRDYAIKQYVYNSPINVIYYKILHMIETNIYTRNLQISEDFPAKMLVDIMKPFFYCYCNYVYGVTGTEKIQYYKKLLNYKMKVFYENNKCFGRKIYKVLYVNKKKEKTYFYNTNHIGFYEIPINTTEFESYDFAEEYNRINGTYKENDSDESDAYFEYDDFILNI